MGGDMLEVVSEQLDGYEVIHARGEVDISSADLLREKVVEVADVGRGLVIDLSEVTFLDSTGLGVLIAARRQVDAASDPSVIDLVVTNPQLLKVLDITGLTGLFRLHASLEGALSQ